MTPRGEPISELDLHLFAEGKHLLIHDRLGAHRTPSGDAVRFAVWAPNARAVSVIGDFNGWQPSSTALAHRGVGDLGGGGSGRPDRRALQAAHRRSRGLRRRQGRPLRSLAEVAPQRASIVWEDRHVWRDEAWDALARGEERAVGADERVRGAPRLVQASSPTGGSSGIATSRRRSPSA